VSVDAYPRVCFAIAVDSRVASGQVIEALTRLMRAHGTPCDIRRAHGPAWVAPAVQTWLSANGGSAALIEPGKPWQNGVAERFSGKCRDECLHMEWFRRRREARVSIEPYRQHYQEERPHSSLGDHTPAEVARGRGVSPPTRSRKPTAACSNPRGLP
jgi:putative transposase